MDRLLQKILIQELEKSQMYKKDVTKDIVETYKAAEDKTLAIEELCAKYNKSVRAIISKLSAEKVYIKNEYKGKNGDIPITKIAAIEGFCDTYNLDSSDFDCLISVPKPQLLNLLKVLHSIVG